MTLWSSSEVGFITEFSSYQALMVGLGAIPGAWLRLRVVNHFEPLVPRKHWGTFVVNLVAAFALGLVLGLERTGRCVNSAGATSLILLVGTGFFGSLSTFSTFAVEVLDTLRERRWGEAVLLTAGSVIAGLLVAAAGFSLGHVDA
ncbi:putative fluoride ion transporter CrcB [Synechococcus sp. MIT S9509]|uniref:fluoride efflux transporter FluC n=1 Tax=unclassified Synechococcus TaxID=2626047 RepID=UPI0007BBE01D|nr:MULTISPECIES: CrcB family protein [unclassified Synechococcus]KZR84328.1 putative fluoride ion transporter CrcB [Synechococcus sp. MIT S9504]KZR89211.1 putative fluoride ion transporter CrcB [Synechococcus sp. MIT S9509]